MTNPDLGGRFVLRCTQGDQSASPYGGGTPFVTEWPLGARRGV